MKISMKREQNDASISSAEREKFGTKFRTFRLFSMAALALVMAACSNEDNAIEQQPAQTRSKIPFSATIAAPNSGATTRTIITEGEGDYEKYLMVAWKGGEEIALVHGGVKDVVTVGVPNSDGSAPISGDITPGADNEDVKLVYPAAAVKSVSSGTTYVANTDVNFLAPGFAQDGTLAYIGNNDLDGRQGIGKLKVSNNKATLKENVKMGSLTAIWKLTLTTNGTSPINAKTVTLKLGTQPIAGGKYAAGKSSYYLCVVPATLKELYDAAAAAQLPTPAFSIEASDGTNTYTFTKSDKLSLSTGNYYQSTLKMVPAGATNGLFTVNDDGGKVYFSKGNLQATYNGTSWSWAFATNQWDYIGNAAGNTSINGNGTVSANNVTVDLFGWVGKTSDWTGAAMYGISKSTETGLANG